MSPRQYAFGDDVRLEDERLRALERAFDVPSRNALTEAGVTAGWRCWEVGAGRGSIARWLAEIVGSDGYVLATDLTDHWFGAAVGNLSFRQHDLAHDPLPDRGFDLVHARFLLEHLADPRYAIAQLAEALRPGGVLVLEDSAGLDLDIRPACTASDRVASAWEQAGRSLGWNPTYGHELMPDMQKIGLLEIRGRQYRQLGVGGISWAHLALGVTRLEGELLKHGVTREHLAHLRRCLVDPANLITGPPVTIAWGRRGVDASP